MSRHRLLSSPISSLSHAFECPGGWGIVSMVVAILVALPVAQGQESDTARASRDNFAIEPYTGPPIFLPEPRPPIPAKPVEQRVIVEYFRAEDGSRIENSTIEVGDLASQLAEAKAKGLRPRSTRQVTRYSDNLLKNDGSYREFHPNGQLFLEAEYKEGEPVGEWHYYHDNAAPAKTVTYQKGLFQGPVELRRPDGTLQATREYVDGKRNGVWKVYGEDGQQLLSESRYAEGKAEGTWTTWFPNGQKKEESMFEKGQRNGMTLEWDQEGNKLAEIPFKQGKLDGVVRRFSSPGVEIQQTYREGELVSITKIDG